MKNKLERYDYNLKSEYVIQEGKKFYKYSKGNWNGKFDNKNPIILELACGNGEYTVERSFKDPLRNYIGIDIKGARIWKGANKLENNKSKNAFFLRIQIENILNFFENNEVDEILISFPDPRPKKRDIKKRLTNMKFLDMYYKILKKNGLLMLKTDDVDLFNYSLDQIKSSGFVIKNYTNDLYKSKKYDTFKEIKTKYELRFLSEGKKIKFLQCLR